MTTFPGSAAMRLEAPNGGFLDFNALTTEIITPQEKDELEQRFKLRSEIMKMLTEGGWGVENSLAAQNMLRALNQLPVSNRLTVNQIDKLLKEIDGTKLTGEKSQAVLNSMQRYKQHLEQLKNSLQNKQEQKLGLQSPSLKTGPIIEKRATLKINVKILNDILNKIPDNLRTSILAALTKEGRPLTAANLVGALAASKDPKAAATIGSIITFLADKGFVADFNRAIKALAENKNPHIIAQVVEALAKDNRPELATKTAVDTIDALAKISSELASQTAAAVIETTTVSHPDLTTKIISHLANTHPEILKTATVSLAADGKIPAVAAVLSVVAEKPGLTAQFVNALESNHQDVLKSATLTLAENGKIIAATHVLGVMTDIKLAAQTANLIAEKLATTSDAGLTAKFIASFTEKQPDIARSILNQMADKQPAFVQQITNSLATVAPAVPVHAVINGIAKTFPDISRATAHVHAVNSLTSSNIVNVDFKGAALSAIGNNSSAPLYVSLINNSVAPFPLKVDTGHPRNFSQASGALHGGSPVTSGSSVSTGYQAPQSFSDKRSPTFTGTGADNLTGGTPLVTQGKVGEAASVSVDTGATIVASGAANSTHTKDNSLSIASNDKATAPLSAKRDDTNMDIGAKGTQPEGNNGVLGSGPPSQESPKNFTNNVGQPSADQLLAYNGGTQVTAATAALYAENGQAQRDVREMFHIHSDNCCKAPTTPQELAQRDVDREAKVTNAVNYVASSTTVYETIITKTDNSGVSHVNQTISLSHSNRTPLAGEVVREVRLSGVRVPPLIPKNG